MSDRVADEDDGVSKLRLLGRLVEDRRIAAGLRPGQLGELARVRRDQSSAGSDVRALELWGRAELTTVVRVVTALGITDAEVLQATGIDLAAMRANWERWAAEPIPVRLSIRLMPAVWMSDAPPEEADRAAVLAWASAHPQWRHCIRCIRWSRTYCTYLRPDGSSYEAHAVFPEDCPEPWMRIA